MKIISRAQRSGGYTSPNVIRILNPQTEEKAEDIFRDERVQQLIKKAEIADAYAKRIQELENELRLLKEDRDRLFKDILHLREQINDWRYKLLG